MSQFSILNKTVGEVGQGYLSYFEGDRDIPFPIKRIYYTYDVPVGETRGMHAHKNLQQLLWCPYGKVEILLDDGKEKTSYLLDSPKKALLILKGYWRELSWLKKDSVLCVAASEYFDEADYIRDYDEFLKLVDNGFWND